MEIKKTCYNLSLPSELAYDWLDKEDTWKSHLKKYVKVHVLQNRYCLSVVLTVDRVSYWHRKDLHKHLYTNSVPLLLKTSCLTVQWEVLRRHSTIPVWYIYVHVHDNNSDTHRTKQHNTIQPPKQLFSKSGGT